MSRSCLPPLIVTGLAALVAFALRAISLTQQSFWRDEVDALCYAFEFPAALVGAVWPAAAGMPAAPCACPPLPAAGPMDGGLPSRLFRVMSVLIHHNGPLYYFLLRGWIVLGGTSQYALRFFSLMFGVLAVPLAYVMGRRMFHRATGCCAALLMAVSSYLIWYGQEVKMYTLLPALALLAVYGLRRAVEGGGGHWWAVQIIATSLAFYSHILAAFLIPVQLLLYFVWWPWARHRWGGALVSLICLTVPYLPLLIWQAPQAFQVRETGFARYGLWDMAGVLLNGWSLGITGVGVPWGGVWMGALALWGTVGWGDVPSWRDRAALIVWLSVPLLAVWLISQRQPLFTDRYLIWAAPAFYIGVAAGLTAAYRSGRWGRPAAICLLAGALIFNGVNLQRQATVLYKSDFRAAAAYVAARYMPGDLIVFQIPHGRYTFDYYFPSEGYAWADGLFTNHRGPDGGYLLGEQDAAATMESLIAGHDTIWLVVSESAMWDERNLTQAWLDANCRRAEEGHFMRVDIYRYTRR